MRYMLLIHAAEEIYAKMSEAEMGQLMAGYGRFTAELEAAGALLGGERLQDVENATTVRVRGGKTEVTDGPFAETKEQFGGYYMIEAKDLDEAIAWAAKVPCSANGCVEVRPIWEMEPA